VERRLSKRRKPKEPPLTQEEFLGLSEEERVEWAKNHTIVEKSKQRLRVVPRTKRVQLKNLIKRRQRVKKDYEDKENKWWGEGYNEKRRYLYKHNEEYRQAELYRKAVQNLRKNVYKANEWCIKYYHELQYDISKYADTYKLDTPYEEYSLGFSPDALVKVLPVGKAIVLRLISENVIPEPHRKGFVFKKNKVSEEVTTYFTIQEVQIIMKVFVLYWKRYKTFGDDNQKKWLRKRIYKPIMDLRNDQQN
jgi:hypothetical protein